jgi:hypothetical protein
MRPGQVARSQAGHPLFMHSIQMQSIRILRWYKLVLGFYG